MVRNFIKGLLVTKSSIWEALSPMSSAFNLDGFYQNYIRLKIGLNHKHEGKYGKIKIQMEYINWENEKLGNKTPFKKSKWVP